MGASALAIEIIFECVLPLFDVIEVDAGASCDAGERIIGEFGGQAGGFLDDFGEAAQERAAASHHDAVVDEIGGEFGFGAFEGSGDGVDDCLDGFHESFADFLGGNGGFARKAGDHVAAAHVHCGFAFERGGGTDFDFDSFGGLLADHHVVGAFHVVDDGFVHVIAGDANRLTGCDACEGHDGDFGGAATDINDHACGGFGEGEACADGGGDGFFDEVGSASAGAFGGIEDGAFFDGGDAGGDGDNDAGAEDFTAAVDLADEVREHGFGNFKVGDNAVFEWANSGDGAWGFTEHFFGNPADGFAIFKDFVGAFLDSNNARFVENDTLAANRDERVAGPEVDSHVNTEEAEKAIKEHAYALPALERSASEVPAAQEQREMGTPQGERQRKDSTR